LIILMLWLWLLVKKQKDRLRFIILTLLNHTSQQMAKAFVPHNGGIMEVGRAFAERLKQKGMGVVFSDNRHDPHDGNA